MPLQPVLFEAFTAACRAQRFSPLILREVRAITSLIAFIACGQRIALVPERFERLAPPTVVVRALAEQVEIVSAALVWLEARADPLVEAAVTLFTGKA